MTPATLYRCHLFSFGGPQSTGIESRWTHDLLPIGESEVLTGEEVELYAKVDAATQVVTEQSKIRFDILEEDFLLTGGLDDRVLTILGTGAVTADSGVTTVSRTTVFRDVASGADARSALAAFRTEVSSYRDNILVLTERDDAGAEAKPKVHHIIGWWLAERLEDWANAEMYFIAVVDDAEDKSEETIDVSPDRAVSIDGPSLPWTAGSAVRRLHSLISTGVFDWTVNSTEAREALRLLFALRADTVMEVIAFMKLDDSWLKLLRALDKHDPDGLVDLQMRLDPDARVLLPNDQVRVTIHAGGVVPEESTVEPIRSDGTIRVYHGRLVVEVARLLPQDAAHAIARALQDGFFHEPSVVLAVTRRAHHYLDSKAPSGRLEFRSDLRMDPNSDAYRRRAKLSRFTAFVAELRNPTSREWVASQVFMNWISRNRTTDEFMTREPEELWEWSWNQAEPPPEPPVLKFLAYYTAMTAGMDHLPAEDRADRIETGHRFIAWVDANDSEASLAKTTPGAVWSRMASGVFVERLREADRKREAALVEKRHQLDVEAAGKKFEEAIALMNRYILPVADPKAIDLPSEGYGYLIMPSDFEREVRGAINAAFLHDVAEKMTSEQLRPVLLRTAIETEFMDWLHARPELQDALWLATSHPYVEKYEVEIDVPGWQTAIEIGLSFIPIIGNAVSAYEAISGESIFGRKLSIVERGIAAASIVVPFAKTASAAKGLVSAHKMAKMYNLGAKEAGALYRAAIPVIPGSAGDDLLRRLFGDVKAGRPIKNADIKDAERLLAKMGMFDRTMAAQLGVIDRRAIGGAALAGVTETQELLVKVVGKSDDALNAFKQLASSGKEAIRGAVSLERDLLAKAIAAETETGLHLYKKALLKELRKHGMPKEQQAELLKAIDALNFERRRVLMDAVKAAITSKTDDLLRKRLDEVADPAGLRAAAAVRQADLEARAAKHLSNNKKATAATNRRKAKAVATWIGDSTDAAAQQKLVAEAKLLSETLKETSLAFRVREGAGTTMQQAWVEFRILHPGPLTLEQAMDRFPRYVKAISNQFVGNYGEFAVAFRLGPTHIILKAPDGMVTLKGTDLVVIPRKGGPTRIIDNKALTDEEVTEVSALTDNLGDNLLDDLADFTKLANAPEVPRQLGETIQRLTRARDELSVAKLLKLTDAQAENPAIQKQIVEILKKHDIELHVSNAGGKVVDVSEELREIGIDMLDFNKLPDPEELIPK